MKNISNKINTFVANHKKFSIFSAVVLLVMTIVICTMTLYKKYFAPLSFLTSLTDAQQVAVGRLISDAYQNIYGYKTVCKTEDIILTKYPETYKKVMAEELNILNTILKKDSLNLEAAIYIFLPYNEMQIVNDFLYKVMRNITDSNDKGIKSACILFEEQADNIAAGIKKHSEEKYGNIIRSILK